MNESCLNAQALSWDARLNMRLNRICSLKRVGEVEFVLFLRDMANTTISILNLMI